MHDHVAIQDLLAEYCERFDAGDFDAFADLFSHGTWFATAGEGPGADPVRRWCDEHILLYDGLPHTHHVTTNIRLDVHDDERAEARSYVTVWQGLADFPLQAIFCGRYADELAVIDGRWSFVARWVHPDVIGDMSRHMREPLPPGPLRTRS